jgi:hypothetical protein
MDYYMPKVGGPAHIADIDRLLTKAKIACEVSEMKTWAENFKLSTPIPQDLVPLLAKDDGKQLEIVMNNVSLGRASK